jgi:hypothetical protein
MLSSLIQRRLTRLGAVAVSVIGLACATACGLCDNTDFKQYVSPDGRMRVVVFTRSCGATTDFTTQGSVVPASTSSMPNEVGNAFVADSNHGQAPGAAGPDLSVRWLDTHTVELSHHAKARIFKAEISVDGVRIVYKTSPDRTN